MQDQDETKKKQGESILQFGKGCKLKQDNEKSDKNPYPQPKQSHKQQYRLWEKYLQQMVEQNREDSLWYAQNKRSTLPKQRYIVIQHSLRDHWGVLIR